ncbi:MAG: hypothetical protein AB7U73_07260 [Pirellulales bacterium]
MKTYVEFRCDRFPPAPGEPKRLNRGRWGQRLAEFLATSLSQRGVETGDLVAEDWGWIVPVVMAGHRCCIGCGNVEEFADGFLCFIEARIPWHRPFRRADHRTAIEALQRELDEILSDAAGIRDKRWSTREEFGS